MKSTLSSSNFSTIDRPNHYVDLADKLSHAGISEFSMPIELVEAVSSFCTSRDIDLSIFTLTAFQILLYRYNNQKEIFFGAISVPGAAHLQHYSLVTADIRDANNFFDVLQQVQKSFPPTNLAETGDTSSGALFSDTALGVHRHLFVILNKEISSEQSNIATPNAIEIDLVMEFDKFAGNMNGKFIYARNIFDEDSIQRFIGHFQTLAHGIATQPHIPVSHLPWLTEAEQEQILVKWNNTTAEFPETQFVHTLFEEQVLRTPEATAIIYKQQNLSYAELNRKANQLAHHLRTLGVGPEILVGLSVERSPEMVIGLFAILKAGGAYVPIDPHHPKETLEYILKDSHIAVLLTQTQFTDLFNGILNNTQMLDLASTQPAWINQPTDNPDPDTFNLKPHNLAYCIYTSGSTGSPKITGGEHRGLTNLAYWYAKETQICPEDSMVLASSYAYVLSQRIHFGTLISGASLCLASEPFDPQEIIQIITKNGIKILNLTQSGFNTLIDANTDGALSGLKQVFLGGEPMQINKLLEMPEPRPAFIQTYGSTECSATNTFYHLSPNLQAYLNTPVPIGKPIANTKIYILDSHLQPLPIGVVGEIYVSGVPVGRGYLNQEQMTTERFLSDPFTRETGGRMYKTGDLGRRLADGNIECLGRNDFQIKLRGHRIELGEIENALRKHPQIRDAALIVYQADPGEQKLAAYAIPNAESEPTPAELNVFLKAILPSHMLPSCYILVKEFPLNRNGKLNRKALPPPIVQSFTDKAYHAPTGEIENKLASIWSELLPNCQIGRDDSFFDIGGTSLLAVSMALAVKKIFDIDIGLAQIYRMPTIKELADGLFTNDLDSWYSLVNIQTKGSRPPLFSIHTITLNNLPQLLGQDQPLYFLRYGMAAKITEEKIYLPPVRELAAHYISEMKRIQPQGPYYLMGFSFGGLVAYEMACQLVQQGEKVNFLCLLDTRLTYDKVPLPLTQVIKNIIHKITTTNLKELYLLTKNNFNPKTEDRPSFDPHVYSSAPDRYARMNYQPSVYHDKVHLIQGSEPEMLMLMEYVQPEHAWREFLDSNLDIQIVTGSHYTIFSDKNIKELANAIQTNMNAAL